VVEFLSHLLRHIAGKLLVIWHGLRSHRGRLVWEFVREQRGGIWLEFLPAYAPEVNPVEAPEAFSPLISFNQAAACIDRVSIIMHRSKRPQLCSCLYTSVLSSVNKWLI
jgi:hypothetical protein